MKILRSTAALRGLVRTARADGARVGFVPTMGFLHDGHLSLVQRARRECDLLVASIFVNPLQFGPREDFRAYPRAPRRDHARLQSGGVDLCFEPEVTAFYPADFSTRVEVGGLDAPLCGRFRPGHFTGVATVVTKLLTAVEPDRLYLGGKDYQQALVLTRLVRDLNLPGRVVICPTVREPDGLAMSSRNVYLTAAERRWAPRLYHALSATADCIRHGEVVTARAAEGVVTKLLADGPGRLQYVEILSAEDLTPRPRLTGRLVLALAYHLGKARLIDNVVVRAPSAPARAAGRRTARKGRAR